MKILYTLINITLKIIGGMVLFFIGFMSLNNYLAELSDEEVNTYTKQCEVDGIIDNNYSLGGFWFETKGFSEAELNSSTVVQIQNGHIVNTFKAQHSPPFDIDIYFPPHTRILQKDIYILNINGFKYRISNIRNIASFGNNVPACEIWTGDMLINNKKPNGHVHTLIKSEALKENVNEVQK